jgi:outer membrane protein TolC
MWCSPFPGRAWPLLAACCLPAAAQAGLSLDQALRLAADQAPALTSQQLGLEAAQSARIAADALPDPRLSVGMENLPISGPDRFNPVSDFMTMQRLGLMQDVPNRAKREARAAGAQAKVEREQAMLTVVRLNVRRETQLAWLGVHYAERKLAQLADLDRESQLLLSTLDARIASGKAMPTDKLMARQDALALADRRDEARRDVAKARVALRRWVGTRGDEALDGEPPPQALNAEEVRAQVHRHAELAPYAAMQAMAQAEAREADAEQHGDWSWEVAYSRRGPQYGDMVSFQISMDLPWQKATRQAPLLLAKQKEAARVLAERDATMRAHQEEVEGQLAEWQALDAQRQRLTAQGQLPGRPGRSVGRAGGAQGGRGDPAAAHRPGRPTGRAAGAPDHPDRGVTP